MSALIDFVAVRDRLAIDLKNASRLTPLGDDEQSDGRTERDVLFSHESDVKNLYCAGKSVGNEADGVTASNSDDAVTTHSADKFFRRIIGDGPDDSRARVFGIVLFTKVEPQTTLWSNFLESLSLNSDVVSLPTFCDACLPLSPDAVERWFGADNKDVFDRAQHELYPVDFTSRFNDCLEELRTNIESRLVECEVHDHNNKLRPRKRLGAFYPEPAPRDFVEENEESITRLYIESFKAKPQFSEDRTRQGNHAAYQQLCNAHSEAASFYTGVRSRSKAFAILVLMSVSSDSEVWLQFEIKCRGSSWEFKDDHFPLSYEDSEAIVGSKHYDVYYGYQFWFCAPVLHEGEYERFTHDDGELRLPLHEKKKIGQGASGKVYRVKIDRNHFTPSTEATYLAMKKMPVSKSSGNELSALSMFLDQPLKHEAIMLPRVCLESKSRIFIFSDIADCNLDEYMKDSNARGEEPSNFDEKIELFDRMVDIAHALEYLHDRLVNKKWHARMVLYHLDVKASNVLVTNLDGKLRFQLTDFGISTTKPAPDDWKEGDRSSLIKDQRTKAQLGDGNSNSPPEALFHGEVDSRADVWAFGTLLARFLVWLAGGYQRLVEFDQIRQSDASGPARGQEFFEIDRDTREPYLKKSVKQYLQSQVIQTPTEDSKKERLLYESTGWLLQQKILICNPTHRESIGRVYGYLRAILQSKPLDYIKHLYNDDSQLVKGGPYVQQVAIDERLDNSPDKWSETSSGEIETPETSESPSPIRDAPQDDNVNKNFDHCDDEYEALEQAMKDGEFEMARELLGRSVGSKRKHGRLLHIICMAGKLEMIDLLIEFGVDVNATDHGMTVLSKVCRNPPENFHETLQHLLQYNQINLEARDDNGATPLIRVSSLGDFAAVDLLAQKQANLIVQDSDGNSPLHHAIRFRSADVQKFLLNPAPGLVSLKNKSGRTALHLCADLGSKDALGNARLLLAANAEVNAEDVAEQTPLDLASQKSVIPPQIDMVELLCSKGAVITDVIRNDPGRHHFEAIRKRL